MSYQIERLTFGGILDQAFRLMRDHFVQITSAFVILYVPWNLALSTVQSRQPAAAQDPKQALARVGVMFAMMIPFAVIVPLAQLFVNTTITDAYLGRSADWRSVLARARKSYWPFLGTSFLCFLFLMGAALLCFFPAVYFGVLWSLVGCIAVVENTFGKAAMDRSKLLVKGNWWRTLGILAVSGILVGLVSMGLNVGFALIPILGSVLTSVVQSAGAGYTSAALVVLYVDLRCRRENFDLDLLAAQIGSPQPHTAGVQA